MHRAAQCSSKGQRFGTSTGSNVPGRADLAAPCVIQPPRNAQVWVRQSASDLKCQSHASGNTLVDAALGQQYGASSSVLQRDRLLKLVREFKQVEGTLQLELSPTQGALQGDWELLWTSERSVHSIVQGQLLGLPVSDIRQMIDLQAGRVTNLICFGWLHIKLQASGPLQVISPTRICYSFDKLQLKVLQLRVPLPVFFKGGGWTDCVLLLEDGAVRVMENSRGDTLVLRRLDVTG